MCLDNGMTGAKRCKVIESARENRSMWLTQVLIQDFNCALQENFLLQGHMYVFGHYICFYSNLFGFETKNGYLH
ncbi:hypothetical protein CsSME_00012303 [Camellia sinensis var. sinensis]